MKRLLLVATLLAGFIAANAETRWTIDHATNTIVMDAAANIPHHDHIEMSGQRAAIVYYWGIDDAGRYYCEYHHVFPLLRMIPNNTHAFFPYRHTTNVAQLIKTDGKVPDFKAVKEGKVYQIGKDLYQSSDIVGLLTKDIHIMLTGGNESEFTFLEKLD